LHATWFVGFRGHDNPDAEIFYARKYATSTNGLVAIDLPKTTPELDDLCIQCKETRTWISTIQVVCQQAMPASQLRNVSSGMARLGSASGQRHINFQQNLLND
jgi:hypothetical protein